MPLSFLGSRGKGTSSCSIRPRSPYFTAVCNTMRLAHGLPVVGHGMTYDFLVANEGARKQRHR